MSAAPLRAMEGGHLHAEAHQRAGQLLVHLGAPMGYDPSPSLPDAWSPRVHPKG